MKNTKPNIENMEVILTVKNMTKSFGPVIALNNVDLTLHRGEILGLIGENGSGKSTLSSIISGMQKAESVEMNFKGETWNPATMIESLEKGIGMIVQESGTIPGITVAENIFLGELDEFKIFKTKKGKRFGFIDSRKMNKKANEILDEIGEVTVRGNMMTGNLDFQTRKLIEIAKIYRKNPDVLVVDETTTALSLHGRGILYGLIRKYKKENKSVIFISHDIDEMMAVCDTLYVLRDGKYIRTFKKEEFDENDIRTSLIGRELEGQYYRNDFDPKYEEKVVIDVNKVTLGEHIKNVSLLLHKGEILGISGLSHCGMHTIGKIMFGAIKPETGEVTINGNLVKNENVAMKNKIGYVAKDRDTESLILSASVKDNISIGGLDKISIGNFLILFNKENEYVDEQINNLNIKTAGRGQLTAQLSGGNKQKVVFAKWIGRDSNVLILDCPTRGVDIGVKQQMYKLMMDLKKAGKSIIMISEELTELIGMCDRLLVMKDGEITKEFMRSETLSDAEIINFMI